MPSEKPDLAENAQLGERDGELGLRRNGDEVVVRLVQHAAAHRELGLEAVDAVEQLDDRACDRRGLGRDLEPVAVRAADVQRALDAHERGQLGLQAARPLRLDARELVFHLGGERHYATTLSSVRHSAARE